MGVEISQPKLDRELEGLKHRFRVACDCLVLSFSSEEVRSEQ